MILKILSLTPVLLMVAGSGMLQGRNNEINQPEVWVRVLDGGSMGNSLWLGKHAASQILASAGVRLRWVSDKTPAPAGCAAAKAIDLQFVYSTPQDYKPMALAEAYPWADSGVRIKLFATRVAQVMKAYPGAAAAILGHVMAHEIGHMLLQVNGHAEG